MKLAVALAALLVLAACNGDDDTTEPTTPPTEDATTVPLATDPPTTIPPPTVPPTTPPTTVAPSTTVDIEALKAEIAADYVESYRARRALTLNPTLDNLEATVAGITATGSPDYDGLLALVQELVAKTQRVVPGDPPIDDFTVELVEITDPTATTARVTTCRVFNWARVDADGIPIGESGVLTAARVRQESQLTTSGWLPASAIEVLAASEGVMTCPDE